MEEGGGEETRVRCDVYRYHADDAEDGKPLPMTPRGHSSISDAVETELQILATERPNITSLL